MKILLASAKQMKIREEISGSESEKTLKILKQLSKMDIKDLEKIYKISEKQALIEKNRINNILNKTAKKYKAIELFDGLMYRNIKRENLSKKEEKFLKENVYITSSLYGIISSFSPISEHRLDFNQDLKIDGISLKNYWKDEYDNFIKNLDDNLIISLLSSEFEDVFSKEIRDKFISIKFLEEKNNKLVVHSSISKKARGKFLSYIIEKDIKSLEEIKKIKFDNYTYNEVLSNKNELIFLKNK